ncbi:MAG: carbohydrate ABC transporter permease, partial [Candidatus Limnocylindria bacterium]
VHIFLVAVALLWLIPTLGLLVTSFRPRGDIQSTGWWEILTTFRFTLDNYADVLTSQGMGAAFLNSLYITVPSTILPVLIASMAAYAFAWMKIPAGDWLFLTMVALMVVPIQMVLVPLLQMFNAMGVTQSFIGIWIAHTTYALPFGIFLLRNFFITLPRDLIEAARIDGASNFRIFSRIVLPLSVPAIASYGIFQFLWVWNDLLMALIFVQTQGGLPMTVQINNLLSTYGTEWHLLSAGAFLLMVVPLAVFFSLQRYFVQGLLAGSVK